MRKDTIDKWVTVYLPRIGVAIIILAFGAACAVIIANGGVQ